MKYLIVIPARGGSKGVKHKNIRVLLGKPMIEYTLDALIEADIKDDIVVSTDDTEIMDVVKPYTIKYSNISIIVRPAEFATDTSSTEDVVLHAIRFMKETYEKSYDATVTMAPNLPIKGADTILHGLHAFEEVFKEFDSQVCFMATSEDMWVKKENGEFGRMFPNAPRRRQDREPLYVEKGLLTITKCSSLMETKSLWGTRIHGFEITEEEGIDIHDETDLIVAEEYIKKQIRG